MNTRPRRDDCVRNGRRRLRCDSRTKLPSKAHTSDSATGSGPFRPLFAPERGASHTRGAGIRSRWGILRRLAHSRSADVDRIVERTDAGDPRKDAED
jgi:hypothetical protein